MGKSLDRDIAGTIRVLGKAGYTATVIAQVFQKAGLNVGRSSIYRGLGPQRPANKLES